MHTIACAADIHKDGLASEVNTVLFEYCCDEASEIGKQAPLYGVACVRISARDKMHTTDGIDRLMAAAAFALSNANGRLRADVHSSIPCTVWCRRQNVCMARQGKEYANNLLCAVARV